MNNKGKTKKYNWKILNVISAQGKKLAKTKIVPKELLKTKLGITIALFSLLLIVFLVAIISFGPETFFGKRFPKKFSKAANTVDVYFEPSSASLPPDLNMKVMVNSNTNQIGFVRLKIVFNPQLINLKSEIQKTALLNRVIQKSTMSEANQAGIIYLVLGLDPADRGNPPSGTFELANFTLGAKSLNPNQAASLAVDLADSQIVNLATNQLLITASPSQLILNPTPTPTPTPTSMPTATPGQTQPPNVTPTPSPDTIPPVVTIRSPAAGNKLPSRGTVKISAFASDASGIISIKIYIDGVNKKVCNSTTTCSYSWNMKDVTTGNHTILVEATDKSANNNVGTQSITVYK